MAKKKNKPLIRPWCWYCEREFEDEKVLMQHQKAKHFKCGMCPRRLNTAGGLAVHIQQVHKLEPENLPRIENALPGRDGYEVEIFGMEGIPAPDVADYKRRKEIELGLTAGSISQPQPKRAKIENRALGEDELRAQLEAHKALMGSATSSSTMGAGGMDGASVSGTPTVYAAPMQNYATPTPPVPTPVPMGISPPPFGAPPFGAPPFAPGFAGIPPGMPPFAPPFPGGQLPPPGALPPGAVPPIGPPGVSPPPPPGARPPFPPQGFVPGMPPPPGMPGMPPFVPPPGMPGVPPMGVPPFTPGGPPPPPQFVRASSAGITGPPGQAKATKPAPPPLTLPNPALAQTNPEFKKRTELKWNDANFSPEERRANDSKYYFDKSSASGSSQNGQKQAGDAAGSGAAGYQGPGGDGGYVDEPRGKKRARAEDFL